MSPRISLPPTYASLAGCARPCCPHGPSARTWQPKPKRAMRLGLDLVLAFLGPCANKCPQACLQEGCGLFLSQLRAFGMNSVGTFIPNGRSPGRGGHFSKDESAAKWQCRRRAAQSGCSTLSHRDRRTHRGALSSCRPCPVQDCITCPKSSPFPVNLKPSLFRQNRQTQPQTICGSFDPQIHTDGPA